MSRLMLNELHKEILESLTQKDFLKRVNISEEKVQSFIINKKFVNNLLSLVGKTEIMCKDVVDLSIDILNSLCPESPKDWLFYIFQYTLYKSFPGSIIVKLYPKYESATLIYLEILRTILNHDKNHKEFDKFSSFKFLTKKELEDLKNPDEYLKFIEVFNENFVYEMMRMDVEINGFNTLEHTAAVHYVAMHVGRQLYKTGIPVNLGLVSGSAAGHDIGKYGCKNEEKKRVAYLHYYYTDLWFVKHDMPGIAHIAANHSTWDLELETLPLESLILIYADFRVKNKATKNGNQMYIYCLEDSFQVILDKLDNIDDAKEKRYKRVYSKLKDFENYLVHRGINIDFTTEEPGIHKEKDLALIEGNEVIENYKYMAIGHNTSLMSKLNNEASFSSIIEAARSEKNWNNIRAYLNIFEEYSTYLTKKQKIFTLGFLYELLINREGDLRRQAAELIGKIIVSFDMEYKKEIPRDVKIILDEEVTGLKLWEKYLGLFIMPDHKITQKHKEWIGYSLKIFVDSVISGCNSKDRKNYLNIFLNYFNEEQNDDVAILNQLNSLLGIPISICNPEQITRLINYSMKALENPAEQIRLMAVQFINYLVKQKNEVSFSCEKIITCIENFSVQENICINYLKYKMALNLNLTSNIITEYKNLIDSERSRTSELFLNNLKAATPWNVKTISIDFIMDNIEHSNEVTLLHTATHLCNLVKVSAKESVRNKAGMSLLEIGPLLTIDQRNEISFELMKGLEIDELQFAKYIPEYLGRFALLLHPKELDEFIIDLKNIYKYSNEKVSALALNTFGITVQYYFDYKGKFDESDQEYNSRLIKILGIILSGLGNYNVQVKQETFLVLGQHIFGSKKLNLKQKHKIFVYIHKKLLTLITEKEISDLFFFNNSASFNHIYRFISDYIFYYNDFGIKENKNIAFFPGTFDPFSLSHKGIATEIRNMGFDVFLAVDEFSWSKRVQPRMIRRQIINMSIADELDVYLFSDDVPVNLSNVEDLKLLKSLFHDKDVYIVVGSDVIINATAYKQRAVKNSIHSFNHIIFNRVASDDSPDAIKKIDEAKNRIKGNFIELKLPLYLEDISSTQIRDNIDNNRDISNLIDPLAQSFIYDRNIYLREPQYKSIIKSKPLKIEIIEDLSKKIVDEIGHYIFMHTNLYENIGEKLISKNMKLMVIRDGKNSNKLLGFSAFHQISSSEVYTEFKSELVANYIREKTAGRIIVIDGIYINPSVLYDNLEQIIITETLAYCLKNDFTYALYYNIMSNINSEKVYEILELQGFQKLIDEKLEKTVYAVDMKFPICLTLNLESFIKEHLNNNPNVQEAIRKSRKKLQESLTKLYPGSLVLSFDNDMINQTLIQKICSINKVPDEVKEHRILGEYMCVPFGNILKGMVVPNTVTKSLHSEKIFNTNLKGFRISEYPFYSPLKNQIKTIKSFDRPVILIDDLMHKGYRIKEIDPIFKSQEIKVEKIIVGIMSGRGKDLMEIQGREIDSAYFIPNLRIWFNENLMYPFLGGDGIWSEDDNILNLIPSINLMLPYVAPIFIKGTTNDALYDLSMVCLENTKNILRSLEIEYQNMYQKNLTLKRIGEVMVSPRYPFIGKNISYDLNIEASRYMDVSIENLIKLERIIK